MAEEKKELETAVPAGTMEETTAGPADGSAAKKEPETLEEIGRAHV